MEDSAGQAELRSLIERLNKSELLDLHVADEMERAYNRAAVRGMTETGKSFGEVTPGLAHLNQPEADFRAHMRRIDNDLTEQVRIVTEIVDGWFDHGAFPPPYYANRIAVILRKEKRFDLERDFIAAYVRHFPFDAKLRDRAARVGILPPA